MTQPLYSVYEGERLATATVATSRFDRLESIAGRLTRVSRILGPIACSASVTNERVELYFANYPSEDNNIRTQQQVDRMAETVADDLIGEVIKPVPTKIGKKPLGMLTMGMRRADDGSLITEKSISQTVSARAKANIAIKHLDRLSIDKDEQSIEPIVEFSYISKYDLPMLVKVAQDYQQKSVWLAMPRHLRVFTITEGYNEDHIGGIEPIHLARTSIMSFIDRARR